MIPPRDYIIHLFEDEEMARVLGLSRDEKRINSLTPAQKLST
jgi:hypothetical protein